MVNQRVDRSVDLTTGAVRQRVLLQVHNAQGASQAAREYRLLLDAYEAPRLAVLTASGNQDAAKALRVRKKNENTYAIELEEPLEPGETTSLLISMVLADALAPYPAEISQNDKQKVLYLGNHYFYSPYRTIRQALKIKIGGGKVEDVTELQPFKQHGDMLEFGPYDNVKAFSESELSVHFEYNMYILKAPTVVREIQVSHWGNVHVEEFWDLTNAGAKLKGHFSRLDFQRNRDVSGSNILRGIPARLPPLSHDVYYRDAIGNISTSQVKYEEKSVDVDLLPRFPLAGGWSTSFELGYDVPLSEFLLRNDRSGQLVFRYPFTPSIPQVTIRDYVLRVVLPEGSSDIKFDFIHEVDSEQVETTQLYLDTIGRPVLVIRKKNVVYEHGSEFLLSYSFSSIWMLQEPALLAGAFVTLFLLATVITRISITISPQTVEEEATDPRKSKPKSQ